MTKTRLVKVRALFYVLQHITKKEAAPILTQPLSFHLRIQNADQLSLEAVSRQLLLSL